MTTIDIDVHPDGELATSASQRRELLIATQKLWQQAHASTSSDERIVLTLRYCETFSAALYLHTLIAAAPAAADQVCSELYDLLSEGDALGERIHELLKELGIDPATIDGK